MFCCSMRTISANRPSRATCRQTVDIGYSNMVIKKLIITEDSMQKILRTIADSSLFQNFIIFVIVLAGVAVGLETYPAIASQYGPTLHIVNDVILWIFVAEVVIKMGAEGKKPWRYFYDPWNNAIHDGQQHNKGQPQGLEDSLPAYFL